MVLVGGAGLFSYAATHLKPAIGTTLDLFLLVISILAIAWAAGFLPVRSGRQSSTSREALIRTCDNVILGWETLAEDCHNSRKNEGQPLTLPNPMDPGWRTYGFKQWLYPVAYFQASTHILRQDLMRANIEVGVWDYQRMSMAGLEEALEG